MAPSGDGREAAPRNTGVTPIHPAAGGDDAGGTPKETSVLPPLTRPLTLALVMLPVLAPLGGCASASKDIAAAHVPTLQYQPYDCEQLDEAARNDKTIVGVGALVFWPALFALGGSKEQEAEYARLKGEHDALMQTAVLKKCPGATPGSVATAGAPR